MGKSVWTRNNTERKNFAPDFATLRPTPLPGPSVSFRDYQTDDRKSPCSIIDLMTFFGRLSSFFRNSGSRDGSECNVMPTGPCALPKDLRSRGEVASTQPFALTWRGCPHCHAPAADGSIGKPLNVTCGSSLIRALNVPLASRKVAAGNTYADCSFAGITDKR
jgi:hypothetical protein